MLTIALVEMATTRFTRESFLTLNTNELICSEPHSSFAKDVGGVTRIFSSVLSNMRTTANGTPLVPVKQKVRIDPKSSLHVY